MKLDDSRRSDNVEDDRGSGLGRRGAGIGIGTIVIVVIGYFMGVSPSTLLSLLNGGDPQAVTAPAGAGRPARRRQRSPSRLRPRHPGRDRRCLGRLFSRHGQDLCPAEAGAVQRPGAIRLRFRQRGRRAFLLSGDQKVYIDLSFYRQLATEFGAPGDFARAYVIAHEVGHHVQNLLGITDKADQAEQRAGRTGANHVSVLVELQADCFAGVWAAQANRCPQDSRARRSGAGPAGGRVRGRRHPAETRAGHGGSGQLHARHFRAARRLVSARL